MSECGDMRESDDARRGTYVFLSFRAKTVATNKISAVPINDPDVPIIFTDKFNVTTMRLRGTRKMFIAVDRMSFAIYFDRKQLIDGKYTPTVPSKTKNPPTTRKNAL